MGAIRNKVLPIMYDDTSQTLYFDTLENFESDGFHFLKEVQKHDLMWDWATHYICLAEHQREDRESSLNELISEIKERINNETLKMGIPIGMQVDNARKSIDSENEEDLKDFIIPNELFSDSKNNNIDLIVNKKDMEIIAGLKIHLISVGNGLSLIDKINYILFDVGGDETISYNEYKKSLVPNHKYRVVLSHWHYDHYKFIKNLVDDDLVSKILFTNRATYGGMRAKETFKYILGIGIPFELIKDYDKIKPYDIRVPKITKMDPNKNSIIMISNEWFLTGDQHYDFINEVIEDQDIKYINNYQIPHHGSIHNGDNLFMDKINNAWISYKSGSKKGPERRKLLSKYKRNIKGAIIELKRYKSNKEI